MGQTLTNGIFLPNEGERNCYTGLEANWRALDYLIGGYNVHVADAVIHVTKADRNKWDAVTNKADASALTAHTGDGTIHVTAADKTTWNTVTSKADNNNVMHLSGNETISGAKTFTDNNMIKTSSPKVLLINTSQTGNTPPSSNAASFLRFDGGTVNNFGGVQCEFLTTSENRLTNYVYDITRVKTNTIQQRASSTTAMTIFNADLLVPINDGVTALGSSSKRWSDCQTKLINGLNLGTLSMPKLNNRLDISSYITNLSGSYNAYTPLVDGWIAIHSSDATFIRIADTDSGGTGNTTTSPTAGVLTCMMPVKANRQINVYIVCTTLASAFFIPCTGNV